MKTSSNTSFYTGSFVLAGAVAAAVISVAALQKPALPTVQLEPIVIVGHKATTEMPLVRLEPIVIVGHAEKPAQIALAEAAIRSRTAFTN